MDNVLDLISRVIPIFLLLALGYVIKISQFLSAKTIEDLKKLVVTFALPPALFITFLNVELDFNIFVFALIIFGLNTLAISFFCIESTSINFKKI